VHQVLAVLGNLSADVQLGGGAPTCAPSSRGWLKDAHVLCGAQRADSQAVSFWDLGEGRGLIRARD